MSYILGVAAYGASKKEYLAMREKMHIIILKNDVFVFEWILTWLSILLHAY